MVDGGDLVLHDVRIGCVEDTLLDDGLIVLVKRNAGRFVDAGTLDAAGLDHERVEAAVLIVSSHRPMEYPAKVGSIVSEITAVRVDAAQRVQIFHS